MLWSASSESRGPLTGVGADEVPSWLTVQALEAARLTVRAADDRPPALWGVVPGRPLADKANRRRVFSCPTIARMPITLVQPIVESGVNAGTPIVLGLAPTPGNLLVAAQMIRNTPVPGTDLDGFTSLAPNPKGSATSGLRVAWRTVQPGDSASWLSSGTGYDPCFLSEWAGVARVAPVDVTAGAGNIATQLVSVSLSPTPGSRLVVAGILISDNGGGNLDTGMTPGAGYTLGGVAINGAGQPMGGIIYRILPLATGADVAPNVTGTGGLPAGNAIIAASFLAAAGGGAFTGEPGGGVW